MTSRNAPYRHSDGSNCWTRDCQRRAGKATSSATGSQQSNIKSLPGIVFSGRVIGRKFKFATTLEGGYDPRKHIKVSNDKGDSVSWTKPHGGLWLATVSADGNDSWNDLINGSDFVKPEEKRTVTFKDEAKVLIINSHDDYLRILDAYPYYNKDSQEASSLEMQYLMTSASWSGYNPDGTSKRHMDYEKISQHYDAVLVTWAGVYSCGRANFMENTMGTDVSLYSWDIESVFVLNKNSIIVNP